MTKTISTKEFIRKIIRIETSLGADKKPDCILIKKGHPWYKWLMKKMKLND
jgi:hypothetical protein